MARKADPTRRENIIKAARQVFQESGYASARMSTIARRAGMAVGTLYLYFDSKDDLVLALGDEFLIHLTQALAPALAQPDTGKALAQVLHIALEVSAREVDLLRLYCLNIDLATPDGNGRRPERQKLDGLLSSWLADGMQKGLLRRYDPAILADMLLGLLKWVSETILLYAQGDRHAYETTLIEWLQRALLPASSPPPAQG